MRTLPALIALALVLSLTACGGGESGDLGGNPPDPPAPDATEVVYVGNGGTSPGTISALRIDLDSGALTPIDGSPFGPATSGVFSLSIDPQKRFAYLTNPSG